MSILLKFLFFVAFFSVIYLIGYNSGYNNGYELVKQRGIELRIVACP